MNLIRQLLHKLQTHQPLQADDLLTLVMLGLMVVSLSHLFTMLATRWGDRNVAVKSLLASVLIHCACLLGLEIFEPAVARAARPEAPQPEAPQTLAEVLIESDQDVKLPEAGNMPLADRPTEPDAELQRLDDSVPEVTAPEIPERSPDELESLTVDAEDASAFEQRDVTEMALPSDAGPEGPRQPAAEDPQADIETQITRSEADVFTPTPRRERSESGLTSETEVVPPSNSLVMAPDLKFELPADSVALNTASASESAISLPAPSTDPADRIQRATAPVAGTEVQDGSLLAGTEFQRRAEPGASVQSRLPRPSRSSTDSVPAERMAPERPERASTPTPLNTDYEDVRIGTLAPSFSEDLETAAAELSSDLPAIRRRDNPPLSYQLRNLPARRDAVERFGGTKESESAVERSLQWFAARQQPDGRWDASDHGSGQVEFDENGTNRMFAGREADTGVTALAMLCFLGAGYTHEDGRYALQVDRAMDWLIRQQGEDGNLFGNAERYARMYCHAMATYSLAEAYGMQRETLLGPIVDPGVVISGRAALEQAAGILTAAVTCQMPAIAIAADHAQRRTECEQFVTGLRKVDDIRLRSALARAVSFTIGQQNPQTGGWRYEFGQEGDVSMFGWQLMSLKSAEIAGVSVPSRVRERMEIFLKSVRQGKYGGLFGYRRNVVEAGKDTAPPTPTMTAEALFCQQMLGYPRDSEVNRESIAFLMRSAPRLSELNYYYWYYGTLAMYQHGGRPWQDWNSVVRDTLVEQQVAEGPEAGSWEPNDAWGRYGGRLYSTALATLTLEVYYRLLPLYRMNETREAPRGSTSASPGR